MTDIAVPAPASSAGQAQGSPQPEMQQTSGEQAQIQELRRKITEQAEQIKSQQEVFNALTKHPDWQNKIRPFLAGDQVSDSIVTGK